MADFSIPEALSSPADKIGRYFSVLSVVPSALLVSWVIVLHGSGAWTHRPNFSAGFDALSSGGFSRVAQIALASLLLGLVLHPLQFAVVQFCEGYWGPGWLGQAAATRRIRFHLGRKIDMESMLAHVRSELKALDLLPGDPDADQIDPMTAGLLVRHDALARALTHYPHDSNDIRPTRLGNMLRRYESECGRPYGLDLVSVWPHIWLLSPQPHVDYVNDQRTQLDLAVRLIVINVLAATLSVIYLWRDGLWLVLALVPYVLAYLFYRGAVVVAAEYGTALATVLDLNRFRLYDALRIAAPTSSRAERDRGAELTTVLRTDLTAPERTVPSLVFQRSQPGE
jgi:hypothetical protein